MDIGNDNPHPRAYILANKVTHARLLPAHSKHAFTYPTLSVLLSLDALESGSLDLPICLAWGPPLGYFFRFGTIWGTLVGLRGDGYLGRGSDNESACRGGYKEKVTVEKAYSVSIRRKLDRILLESATIKASSEIRDAWMMTMPSICAFEGINPLTVYFCYRPSGETGIVILEVHNTFGEGHVYTMEVGKDEDLVPPRGYDHQWTFPRRFFVSPFNDRSGFYTVSVKLPSHPPFHMPSSFCEPPKPQVRVHLHMPSSSSPQSSTSSTTSLSIPTSSNLDRRAIGPLKFIAHLTPKISTPLTTAHLLAALSRLPFALLLTLPRILYEASMAHYRRGLRVVGRPEAMAAWLHIPRKHGTIENREHPGGIIYQKSTMLERYARNRMRAFLERRCVETGVKIVLVPGDPWEEVLTFEPANSKTAQPQLAKPDQQTSNETLTISYTSPRIFTLFLTAPSLFLFFLAGCMAKTDGERPLFEAHSEGEFMCVFEAESDEKRRDRNGQGWAERMTQQIRRMPLPQSLLVDSTDPHHRTHPLHVLPSSILMRLVDLLAVSILLLQDWVGEKAFDALGVRFVEGTEPWERYVWKRAAAVYDRM
ncbi:hypothetical protein PAXRUDRAFT_31278 [Paxillus rubicundulus Ve08.2h10]|uniref:Unplaced genomic scaffold scaffold_77, whole genome shotgun sequence n=1 Tax=Paxillus rubicundulus Ve08.2h10 TaxID=930991 RepID=A0A0D0E2L3_9AGAM|nr:hypothetical protein PAXRUDRAFT_31278 [Paxillus rubicundulus Ve08.2h10]